MVEVNILDQLAQVVRENVPSLVPVRGNPALFPLSRGTLLALKHTPEIIYQVDRWDYKKDQVRYYQLSRSSGDGRSVKRCNVKEDWIALFYDVVSF